MQTVVKNLPLRVVDRVPSPGGFPAPAFWDEADSINAALARAAAHNRHITLLRKVVLVAIAFFAGYLAGFIIQPFYR